jgi:hypothetical protein
MPVATKKPAVKKPVAKKTTAKKPVKSPAKKATVKPISVKTTKRVTATDEAIIAFCEEQFAKGVVHASAMRRNAKGTNAYTFSERFNPLAKSVIDKNGGKPKTERVTRKSTKRAPASLDRVTLMKQEHAALKAWKAGGMIGDSPLTPTLDAGNAALKAKSDAQKAALATKKAIASVKASEKKASKIAK